MIYHATGLLLVSLTSSVVILLSLPTGAVEVVFMSLSHARHHDILEGALRVLYTVQQLLPAALLESHVRLFRTPLPPRIPCQDRTADWVPCLSPVMSGWFFVSCLCSGIFYWDLSKGAVVAAEVSIS